MVTQPLRDAQTVLDPKASWTDKGWAAASLAALAIPSALEAKEGLVVKEAVATAEATWAAETAVEPGAWQAVNEGMSARVAAYQAQIAGRTGQAYVVNGVKFDSYTAAEGLVDAKGPGYATFVKDGEFKPFFQGSDDMVAQAQRQVGAANGTPITWHVAEPEAATAIRNLLNESGITGVKVVHTPVGP